MAMTKLTTMVWNNTAINEQRDAAIANYIKIAKTAGKTDGVVTSMSPSPLTRSRKWVDAAAAADWIEFITKTANDYSNSVTVTVTDI